MNAKKMQALYGLKWNPFTQDIPPEAILRNDRFEQFCYRLETMILDGGFSMISGENGLGKSITLRAIHDHLSKITGITVGEIIHPQSGLRDFYREMGALFGVELSASNRWSGCHGLREKWRNHIASNLLRPVLLIDEAQEVPPVVLSELRLLSMEKFDSVNLLTVVLSGDTKLQSNLKQPNLISLGTRIRTRLIFELWPKLQLVDLLEESIKRAGNPNLFSSSLIETLAEHAAGVPRIMMNLAYECLSMGLKKEAKQIDQDIFFDLYPPSQLGRKKKF